MTFLGKKSVKNGQLHHFLDVRKSQERQAIKKFYNKSSENSRSEIVFRKDIFRKLTLGALDYMSIYNRFCKVLYVNVNKCCDISMTRERRIYDLGTKSKWDGNIENRSSREVLSSGAFPLWIESILRHIFTTLCLYFYLRQEISVDLI